MEWFLLAAILGGLFGSKSIGRKYGSAKRSAKAKFKANNPLGGSYWKRRIKPNERFSNFGAALATPRDKKRRSNNRAIAANKRNKNNLDSCRREKEQLEHEVAQMKKEIDRLIGRLHKCFVLFEEINGLGATMNPSKLATSIQSKSSKGMTEAVAG